MSLRDEIFELWPQGPFKLFNVKLQQSFSALFVFDKLLEREGFSSIIELGSGRGALSLFFATWAWVNDLYFVTVEIRKGRVQTLEQLRTIREVHHGKIGVLTADFHEPGLLEAILEEAPTRRLILCDGSNKPREVDRCAEVLGGCSENYRDIIIGHDYKREIFDGDIPEGWEKWEPWQSEAVDVHARLLILRRKQNAPAK